MIFKVEHIEPHDPTRTVSMRCPSCRQRGTFESVRVHDLFNNTGVHELRPEPGGVTNQLLVTRFFGQRRCPNPDCRTHIFFVYETGTKEAVVVTYPAERIDFDATKIPPKILAALEEAISCHASKCYIASAMLVRKTLEELCADRNANGGDLKAKLKELRTKVILSEELMDATDDLRLLGNDAAHIESKTYDDIGQEEVELSIDITKEVSKSIYQYSDLLERLQAYKKKKGTSTAAPTDADQPATTIE